MILIEKLETSHRVVVVYVDWSDSFVLALRDHEIEVFKIPFLLLRPLSIAEDEIEQVTGAIFPVVLKTRQPVVFSLSQSKL